MTGSMVKAFAPGRVEVAGNHTDHQRGIVIAAAVAQGVSATARPNGTDKVNVRSDGFAPFAVNVFDLAPRKAARGLPEALVRGVLDASARRGVELHGFDIGLSSTVAAGAGLSSSAAFELAVAATVDVMFAGGGSDALDLAKAGMYAEREHFGKPCGLMDQLASAFGGIVEIDFANPGHPVVSPISFDLRKSGYTLCLVDSRCDHSRFNEEFAAIPREMRAVAKLFGKEGLRQVSESVFWENVGRVRASLGDRAALRAMHFFTEERLVESRARALRAGDVETFLRLTCESGISSAELLQNISTWGSIQPAMVALAVVAHALAGEGACRIHGGGFGGCIQAFVPNDRLDTFVADVEEKLGAGVCNMPSIGHDGASAHWE